MLNELKKDKIRLLLYLIIVLEIIILMCLTVYRVNEFKNNNKEVIKDEQNKDNIDNEKEEDESNNGVIEQSKEQIKILVDQINIREAANETSKDIGDVFINEVFDVLDIIDTTNYTWYKINKEGITGYVASKKDEKWIEYNGTSDKVEKTKKSLYFYEQDGKLYVDEENKNNNYIGSYNCKSDYCGAHYVTHNIDNQTIVINDDLGFIYNYKDNIIVSNEYDFIIILEENPVGKKNDKVVLLDWKGKEISKYYDDIFDYFKRMTVPIVLQNYSLKNNIVSYESNGKYGVLSLKDGSEITDEKYDEISIYDDNIVATINGLDYVMDSSGNIKSTGFKKILSSNDKIIVIEENEMIDIIDYNGNSKIKEKIPSNGYEYTRTNYYECIGCKLINIKYDDSKLTIVVDFKNYNGLYVRMHYIYDFNQETLTVEEH